MSNDRRQARHGRQGATKVVRRQAQQAGVRRQRLVIPCCMLDGMRPRQQLGEDKGSNEEQMTQGIHDNSLIDLDE